jgi:hypothetical protein
MSLVEAGLVGGDVRENPAATLAGNAIAGRVPGGLSGYCDQLSANSGYARGIRLPASTVPLGKNRWRPVIVPL